MSANRPSILCIIDTVGAGGGAEQLVADVVPEMRRQGAHIEVVALFDWADDLGINIEREGIVVHRLHLDGPLSLGIGACKLGKLLKRARYDVFWGHLYYGNVYGWLARRLAGAGRFAATLHSEGYLHSPPRGSLARISVAIERHILRSADQRVAVSDAVRLDYAAYFGLGETAVVHNGVNTKGLEAAIPPDRLAGRRDFGFADSDFLLVTPARYVAKKGHAVLLDALELLRDQHAFRPKAFFCGSGPLFELIANEVSRRGLADQVTASSVIPHEKLIGLIAASQAVVMPSLREPFGLAAAEAMAVGTPCVLTDVDGFRELAAQGACALLVPPGDSSSLAEAILKLRSDPDLGPGIARNALQQVREKFGIARCATQWRAILRDGVGENGSDP